MNEPIRGRSCCSLYKRRHGWRGRSPPPPRDLRRDIAMSKFITAKWILPAVAAAGIAATALPGLASAQDCYQRRADNGTNVAVLGAVAGGAIGGATSGHREKGVGTVAGAILGAVVGSSVGRDSTHCYYDRGYAYDAPPPPPVVYEAPPPRVVYRETVYAPPPPPPVVVYDDDYYGGYYYHRPVYRHWHRW